MADCCNHNHEKEHHHDHDHEQNHNHGHEHDHDHGHEHDHEHGPCCSHAPAELERLAAQEAVDGGIRTAIRIMQMDCPIEETLIRTKLGRMSSVKSMEFNLLQRVLTIVHDPEALDEILAAIRSLGFQPQLAHTEKSLTEVPTEKPLWPLVLACVAAIAAEGVSWMGQSEWLVASLAIVAVAISGLGTFKKGLVAITNGNLNINALMSIAVIGALFLGVWPEAAMVMVLFTIAELIEVKSLDRTRNAIEGLMKLAPEKATVQQDDGSWREVAASTVAVGSLVRVKPGERIGLDGTIVVGCSSVNQAPITGESLPVEKAEGDAVFAGTINESGSFEYRVTAAASNSTIARIIHAVEEAQGAKAPTQRFVDRFARVYTPCVFLIALAIAVLPPLLAGGDWHDWIYKALVLLVIACPCALVISTPVSIVSGLAAAARHGILIKGGVYLEEGRKLSWLAFDKTGTLTQGKPVQTNFEIRGDLAADRCRQLAASLAAHSDHPVSLAVLKAAEIDRVPQTSVTAFEALAGRGVRGDIEGRTYFLGNRRLVEEQGLCSAELANQLDLLESQGKSVVMLSDQRQVLALFAVADTVKDTSYHAIEDLHRLGIKTVMLSGDNLHTAQSIAAQVGIDQVRGNQLPEDKLKAIEEFGVKGMVGMVGDGINDAPALARADIGFAMGAMGSDTAIETADVALMDDDLRKIPTFVRLSHATRWVLVQNIVLALGIKVVFVVLTLVGLGTMWMAVFADVGASLLVVFNGLRLLRE
jgi:Cd2+/Zn2+-exporting ATPase